MNYLRDAWYAAALSDELKEAPLGRTLLSEPVVLFRTANGEVSALPDRCPHRFAPLSRGRVDDDAIVCGYHGLRLKGDGSCIDTRLSERVRLSASLRPYPSCERYGVVWIWMGSASFANPEAVPDFDFLEDPGRVVIKGLTPVKANYQLEIDNLLDLSHLDYVHLSTIANGSLTQGQHSVRQEGATIYSDWWSPDVDMPLQFRAAIQTPDWKCDSWYEMRWDAPGTIRLDVGVCPVGADRVGRVDALQAHLVTPETDGTCWYFWIVSFQDFGEAPEIRTHQLEMIRRAFEDEDRPMIEAQQRAMSSSDFWAEKPIIFPTDSAAVRARRLLEKLIREEQRLSGPALEATV